MKVKSRALRRSLQDFQKHPWQHLISISTLVVALVIVGIFFLCLRNFEYLAQKSSPHVVGTAFLKEGLKESDLSPLEEKILSLQNVQKVKFRPKEAVVDELRGFFDNSGMEMMAANEAFPDLLELELGSGVSASDVDALKAILGRIPQILEVDFSEDWLGSFEKVRRFFQGFGAALMGIILLGCAFLTANFMGIRHQSRREEIEVVRLMGAERRFILIPFLWEGIIEGLLSSMIALVILILLKAVLTSVLSVQWTLFAGVKGWLFLSAGQLLFLMFFGVLMACLGSILVFFRFQESYR